ncbi:MAG TPA: hypothetical protein VL981_02575, partial [Candidatus Methylacidiphilales bacterium]|nr:hypothetical protein [Candidatus Methylacidiphilales bacterium]
FLIGAVSGGLITWSLTEKSPTDISTFMTKTNDRDQVIVDRINTNYAHDYSLSPEELARIQPLVKAMAQHTTQIRHQFAADFIATFEENHAKIAAQLDPPHREAYLAATAKKDKELRVMLGIDSAPSDGPK